MKRVFTLMAALVFVTSGLLAQVHLTDAVKVTDSKRYDPFTMKSGKTMNIADYHYSAGFLLDTGLGGLISDPNPGGYVVFALNGAYNKLTFVMGPGGYYRPNSNSDDRNVIVTVKGDGQTLMDEVVWNHDAPREMVLDVKGVKELRFDVFRGEVTLAVGAAKLWKAGQTVVPTRTHLDKILVGKVQLVEQLVPYYIRCNGFVTPIASKADKQACTPEKEISINRVTYKSGLSLAAYEALAGHSESWTYFWLQKKYDKLSFIIGPRDNQSTKASAWFTVKGDGRILYEKLVSQTDMAEQVVVDISGVNQLSMHSIDEQSDFGGGITFGVVDIYAYPKGSKDVPKEGLVNGSKERISQLPDVLKLCSNIKPFSVRGISSNNNTYFDGASQHYHFSMGGDQFSEGFVLTTGNTLLDDNIDSYVSFDLAGEYDWVSFTTGCLSNHQVLDDDHLLVYADDRLALDTIVHPIMPNMHIKVPINGCRILRFAKPGTGNRKQTYVGVGDVVVYRGNAVPNNLFVHPRPEMPETVDLIDLTKGPYFHYVGRYLSSVTPFNISECFKDGSSKREYFQMKDGSKIYKGIMLETNIPFGFEDAGLFDIVSGYFMHYGFTAGVSYVCEEGGQQSSIAAFDVFNEYETCTFTVANKSVYVDEFDEMFGDKKAPPVELKVFADNQQVGSFMLTDDMKPSTYTVPIHKCEQLMFWLQCGDVRSGQYVLYDMTLDKKKK